MQPSAAQCSPVQLSAAQYSPVQPSTVQYSTVQLSRAWYSPVQSSKVQYSPVQSITAQYSPSSSLTSSHLLPCLHFQKPHSLLCLVWYWNIFLTNIIRRDDKCKVITVDMPIGSRKEQSSYFFKWKKSSSWSALQYHHFVPIASKATFFVLVVRVAGY